MTDTIPERPATEQATVDTRPDGLRPEADRGPVNLRFSPLQSASWEVYAETGEEAIERMIALFDPDKSPAAETRRTAVADYRGPYIS